MERKCPPSKPNPPCGQNRTEKKKIYKDGSVSICCYVKKKTQTKKSNNNLKRNCPLKKPE